MTKRIQSIAGAAGIAHLLPVGMVFFLGVATAQAKQCSAAIPSNSHSYWSWRLIDGRKCWYEGKPMLSKSSLEWPVQAQARSASNEEPGSVLNEKPNDPLDSKARAPDSDSFEALWRARTRLR
jgi:hypothetical protein